MLVHVKRLNAAMFFLGQAHVKAARSPGAVLVEAVDRGGTAARVRVTTVAPRCPRPRLSR